MSRGKGLPIIVLFVSCSLLFMATGSSSQSGAEPPSEMVPAIESTIPHDPDAFTQGLAFHQGVLYESTGLYGNSSVRKVDPVDGSVLNQINLTMSQFGEGLAIWNQTLYQLTWKSEIVHMYRMDDLGYMGNHSFEGEGWGLCHDGDRFVMSDGSANLTFRSSEDFSFISSVTVTKNGTNLSYLNELECAGGLVFANVWYEDTIYAINPDSGHVTVAIDASSLRTEGVSGVMNGIAYDSENNMFYVTGKEWPTMFRVVWLSNNPDVPSQGSNPDLGEQQSIDFFSEVFRDGSVQSVGLVSAALCLLVLGKAGMVGTRKRGVHNPSVSPVWAEEEE